MTQQQPDQPTHQSPTPVVPPPPPPPPPPTAGAPREVLAPRLSVTPTHPVAPPPPPPPPPPPASGSASQVAPAPPPRAASGSEWVTPATAGGSFPTAVSAARRNRSLLATLCGVAALVLVLILAAKACSAQNGAKSMTCQEYLSQSVSEQMDTIKNILSAHNLKTSSYENQIGAEQAIASFCSRSANYDQPIDKSTDWSSQYW